MLIQHFSFIKITIKYCKNLIEEMEFKIMKNSFHSIYVVYRSTNTKILVLQKYNVGFHLMLRLIELIFEFQAQLNQRNKPLNAHKKSLK